MTKSDLGRTVAALACTIVMSATCVLGAIAPAQAGRIAAPQAMTASTAAPVA